MNQDFLEQFTILANLPGNQSYLLSHKETNEIFIYKTILQSLQYEDQARAVHKRYHDLQSCQNLCNLIYFQMDQGKNMSVLFNEAKINFRKEIASRMPRKQYWSIEELLNTFWHVLVALNNFHYVGLFHGDIRVNSIACKSDGSILLLDQFCTSNSYYKTVQQIIEEQEGFLSPEFIESNQELTYTTIENDVFSLGLVYLETCTLKKSRELYDWNKRCFNYQIYQERLKEVEKIYGFALSQFIAQMTNFCIKSRISTEEALVVIAKLKNNLVNNQQKENQSQNIKQNYQYLQQSEYSQQNQKSSPHYLDQSESFKSSTSIATAPSNRDVNINLEDNQFSQQTRFNNQQIKVQQQQQQLQQQFSFFQQQPQQNLFSNSKQVLNQDDIFQKSKIQTLNQQNLEQRNLIDLQTGETTKDSKNQEITQSDNFNLSENSVSILSFENTNCSNYDDIQNDKRRQLQNYQKNVFQLKDLLNIEESNIEKENSVFYMVEEEEGIDKQFIQKTMVNRIEKEKREHEQRLNQNHIEKQKQCQKYQQGNQFSHGQVFQCNSNSIKNKPLNHVPANPRYQQANQQVRRNSNVAFNQQIFNQKENISQNSQQIIESQLQLQNSQLTNMLVSDLMSQSSKQTRKIRGLNKSVDMSKTINLSNSKHTPIQISMNQIQLSDNIQSCKYNNKQEYIFKPIQNLQEGINPISYDLVSQQQKKPDYLYNITSPNHEKQLIKTLFQKQPQDCYNPNQNIQKQKELNQMNNQYSRQQNGSYNNNEEWNYPSNSQRFAYIQIRK